MYSYIHACMSCMHKRQQTWLISDESRPSQRQRMLLSRNNSSSARFFTFDLKPSNVRQINNLLQVPSSIPTSAPAKITWCRRPLTSLGASSDHASSVRNPLGVMITLENRAAPCWTKYSSVKTGLLTMPAGNKKLGPDLLPAEPQRIKVTDSLHNKKEALSFLKINER